MTDSNQLSFEARSRKVALEYVNTVVLLDDDWPEFGHATPQEPAEIDPGLIEEGPGFLPEVGEAEAAVPSASAASAPGASRLLRDVERSVVSQGIAFTGLKYSKDKAGLALRLIRRAEIVVLDWNLLERDDGAEALELLAELRKHPSGPRFILVFTGQTLLDAVRRRIVEVLGPAQTQNDEEFRCGSFVFALRSKETIGSPGGKHTPAADLLDSAVGALAGMYSSVLALAMMEVASRHRERLGSLLEAHAEHHDRAIAADWVNEHPAMDFAEESRKLFLDEWRAQLEDDPESRPYLVMSDDGIQAWLDARTADFETHTPESDVVGRYKAATEAERKRNPELLSAFRAYKGTIPVDRLTAICASLKQSVETFVKDAPDEFYPRLRAFMKDPRKATYPFPGKSDPKGDDWRGELLYACLALAAGFDTPDLEQESKALHGVLSQVSSVPTLLRQGTILRIWKMGCNGSLAPLSPARFLVCITPSCDALRPQKIRNVFSFVQGSIHDGKSDFSIEEGTAVVVRGAAGGDPVPLALAVNPPVVLLVPDRKAEFVGQVRAVRAYRWHPEVFAPMESDAVYLEPISQLRRDHALLVSGAAIRQMSRIGVESIERVRTMTRKPK